MNRKDRFGNKVFEGGFLGFVNMGVFHCGAPLPTGGNREQEHSGWRGWGAAACNCFIVVGGTAWTFVVAVIRVAQEEAVMLRGSANHIAAT